MNRRSFLKGLVGAGIVVTTPALARYYGIVREPPNYPPVEGSDCGNVVVDTQGSIKPRKGWYGEAND